VEFTNPLGMKFVLIPAGEFRQGSLQAEIDDALKITGRDRLWKARVQGEAPQHVVRTTRPFYLGATEVTQAQFQAVMEKNPSHYSAAGPGSAAVAGLDTSLHPVESLPWEDVAAFCTRLSEREQLAPFDFQDPAAAPDSGGYRLPTEAEWEFACRAGTTTRFWSGDSEADLLRAGWCAANAGGRTHPVGELAQNPFGLSDVHGNVWELTRDGWDVGRYRRFAEGAAVDPMAPPPPGGERVIRGGDQADQPLACRAAHRGATPPNAADPRIGFRVSLPVEAVRRAIARGQ
jgi:formylglycine-generating enzyme required for sulfatase activity